MIKKIVFYLIPVFIPCSIGADAQEDFSLDLGGSSISDGSSVGMAVNAIRLALAILGFLAFLIFISGGFKKILGTGNVEAEEEARAIIKSGIVGMFVIIIMFIAVRFIIEAILRLASYL